MSKFVYRVVVSLSLLVWATGCQESTTLPTAPSSLPPDKIGVLTIACPADPVARSLNGVNAQVDYAPPQTSGGQAPVSAGCSPESGTALPIGTTPGRCTATDTLGQTVSCSFLVQVLPAAQLSKTKFLAFGDSLTAGITSSALTLLLEPGKSYPFKLQEKLARKYPTQTIEVVNAGLPGEMATDGVGRLGTQINAVRPDVVLIMEGTNDALSPGYSVSATSAALDSMVDDVFSRDAEAMIATVPPVRPGSPGGEAPRNAQDLNGVIRAIAFSNGVPLVDVYGAVVAGSCPSLPAFGFSGLRGRLPFAIDFPCIGDDNIHPTPEGYEVIADAFFNVIVNTYDSEVFGARPSRRRSLLGRER